MSAFRVFVLSVISILLSVGTVSASSSDDENAPVTRKEIPALVKKALLDDTSILSEVIDKMQKEERMESINQSKEAIQKNKDLLFNDSNSPEVGPKDADIVIVEFFDYHCGYCKKALGNIIKLLENDKKVRIVFKEYPILSNNSIEAARTALAVNNIDKSKYFDFHRAIFDSPGQISEDFMLNEAKKLGIDPLKLKAEISNPDINKELERNRKLGAEIGAQGTPAMVIGDDFYSGAIPYDALVEIIKRNRANK
ncbi:MAG: DsbA family protein [Rickettsiales bacterium]